MSRGILLIGPSLPAGQNNPVYQELNTLTPLSAMQVLPESRAGEGGVAMWLIFSARNATTPYTITALTMPRHFLWPFAGIWQLHQ